MHSSSWYANPGDVFPATCRMWLICLAALSWRDRPDFAFALLSTGSFAPVVKWSTRPHGLFALPAAVHAWERTCHFRYCSYAIFNSNTDEINKNIAVICNYHFRRTFRYGFVNIDTCVKNTAIYHCSFIIWAYVFLFKRCGKRDQNFLIRMFCVFIII